MKIKQIGITADNEKGMVLVTTLLLTAALIILGTTAVMQTSTDLRIGSNYKTSRQAFYDADAGVQYVLKQLAGDLDSGTVDLTAYPISLSYSTPSGFSFTLPTALTSEGNDQYSFQVTGHGPNNSETAIEVVLSAKPKSFFDYGLFTNGVLDLKSEAKIYSYDSRDTPVPDPEDFPGASTGEADISSNTEVISYEGTYIDGDLALGADTSDPPVDATWTSTGTPVITGTSGTTVENVDSDPLGVNDPTSELYAKFEDVDENNDNDLAGGSLDSDLIYLVSGETLTLTTGDYYVTDITLKNGSTLQIDATDGPVNIYLSGTVDAEDGELEVKNGAVINSNFPPTEFTIFSNAYQDITLKHSSDFKGMIYAPNAHIDLKNSAGVYGLIWGDSATIHNSGEFYFDEAIKDKYSSSTYTVEIASWKDNSLN
ncbi:MAG: pilus assembly PilX N-terminal domain-containing protein [Deltaproteobacteria bacterium]|nr:pilus assembly PilX N-terminal domain-containing protein [Deltaproteobacteria bacterium]